MESYTLLHKTNLAIHITAGSLALLIGLVAILTRKGGQAHRKSGLVFLVLLLLVISTGLLGVFVFGRNSFLLVITMLSAYLGFSGYRVIKSRSNQFHFMDAGIAILTLASVCYFLYYFRSIGMIWSPVIIFSTVGYLFLMIAYDFLRYLIAKDRYKSLWLYEHILKMISAYSAILSAFTGTVLPNYQPYSQFLPSVVGTLTAIAFMIYISSSRKNFKSEVLV